MNNMVKILAYKLGGLLMVIGSFIAMPYMDGDITYSLITVPLGLVMLVTKPDCLDDDLLEEDDYYEDEEL